jgi:hypothetical protein
MPENVRKRLERAKHEIDNAIDAFDRLVAERRRFERDLTACLSSKKTSFYRCTCTFLREKGERCFNPQCSQS